MEKMMPRMAGMEMIYDWLQQKIDIFIENLHEVNMHQLANVLEEKIPV